MRLLTAKEKSLDAVQRWKRQYCHGPAAKWDNQHTDKEAIHKDLKALGDYPSPDSMADVIGNGSWTHPRCGGCGNHVQKAVDFAPEYRDAGLVLCKPCLEAALHLIKN